MITSLTVTPNARGEQTAVAALVTGWRGNRLTRLRQLPKQALLHFHHFQRPGRHASEAAHEHFSLLRQPVRGPCFSRRGDITGLWRGVQQDPGDLQARGAVGGGVMEFLDQRLPPLPVRAGRPVDEVKLPQRPGAIERPPRYRCGQLGELAVIPGRRQGDLVQVVRQIKVRIFDPVRLIDAERDLDEPATQRRKQVQALLHDVAQVIERQRCPIGLEREDIADMLE
jgi:hypothetical protein